MEFINYDIKKYNFRKIIEDILVTDNLEKIHLDQDYELFVKGTDQSTVWHRRYYDNL